tara:strand:- start:3482 stop:3907 length:426 start_codon:yes stop_codon:yes gene_type:complete
MKAFEIQTYQDGKWRINSIFDDRELALFEARRVDESSRYSAVRVIEELFDETSSKTSTKTIFRGGRAADPRTAREPDAKKKTAVKRTARGAANRSGARRPGVRRPPAQKKTSMAGPVVLLLLVIVLGGAAMFGLQYFEALR